MTHTFIFLPALSTLFKQYNTCIFIIIYLRTERTELIIFYMYCYCSHYDLYLYLSTSLEPHSVTPGDVYCS